MTWRLWLVLGLVMLVIAAVGLSAYGERQWAGEVSALQASLEAGRLDGRADAAVLPTR